LSGRSSRATRAFGRFFCRARVTPATRPDSIGAILGAFSFHVEKLTL